jgi:hypothetical protein
VESEQKVLSNDVLYLKLVNNEILAGRYVSDNDEYLTVEYPMSLENKQIDGVSAINLIKYLPFNFEQILILKKNHIIAMTNVTMEFARYYYNTIHYQAVFIQPHTEASMNQINLSLETVLSKDSQEFSEAMKFYQKRIPEILSNRVH